MCPISTQGLRADNKSEAFAPYVEGALALLRMVVEGMAQAPNLHNELMRT